MTTAIDNATKAAIGNVPAIPQIPEAIQQSLNKAWAYAVTVSSEIDKLKAQIEKAINGDNAPRVLLPKVAEEIRVHLAPQVASESLRDSVLAMFLAACAHTESTARTNLQKKLSKGKDSLVPLDEVPTVAELCSAWADAKSLTKRGLENIGLDILTDAKTFPNDSTKLTKVKAVLAKRRPGGSTNQTATPAVKVESEKLAAMLVLFGKTVADAKTVENGDEVASYLVDVVQEIAAINRKHQLAASEKHVAAQDAAKKVPTAKAA